MSEQAAAPAATPAVTPSTTTEGGAAPEAPTRTETSGKPATARDFLDGVSKRARGHRPDAAKSPAEGAGDVVVDAKGNRHSTQDGKFVEKVDPYTGATSEAPAGEKAGDEPASPEGREVPAAEASADGATDTEAGEKPASETVRLALPEGHPLRERGLTELPFEVPKEHEEIVRSLVNEPTRKREVAEAREQARKLQAAVAEARAEAEFWRVNQSEFLTPEFYAQYDDIRQTYGDEAAERYKRGVLQEAQGKLGEHQQQAQAQLQAKETVTTALQFRQAALTDAQRRFPGWAPAEVNKALQAYGAWVNATGTTQPTAADWYMIAEPIYANSEAGRARKAQEAERIQAEATTKATAEAKEREREQLERAAGNRRNNPLGGSPNVQTGLTVPGGSDRPATAKEFLAGVKRRARGY